MPRIWGGVIRRRDLALETYFPASWLNRQVNQEARIVRPAQARRGPVAFPVRHLNKILLPEVVPQMINWLLSDVVIPDHAGVP
jgi:hypothetical protein